LISLLPALTRVLPVAIVAFCVSSDKVGMTVNLTQSIVVAAALSAAVSQLPNKFVNMRFVSIYPPRTDQVGSLNSDARGDPPWARNVWAKSYSDVPRCAELFTFSALAQSTITPPLPGRTRFYERKEDLVRFLLLH